MLFYMIVGPSVGRSKANALWPAAVETSEMYAIIKLIHKHLPGKFKLITNMKKKIITW